MLRKILGYGCRLGILAIATCALLGRLGHDDSALDLASHFQVVYLCLSTLLGFVFVGMRLWRWLALAIGCALASAAVIVPWYRAPDEATDPSSVPRSLRVLIANVYFLNSDYAGIAEAIRECDADVVTLCELTPDGAKALEGVLRTYEHRLLYLQHDPQGIAVYSRWPLTSGKVNRVGASQNPALSATLDVEGKRLSLVASHPRSALNSVGHALRNDQLAHIGLLVKSLAGPVLVMGDLNTTMWSPFYQRLEQATGLVNARKGHGVVPTWPSFLPSLAQIPIDHVLVSPEIKVADIRSVELSGSDHLGLLTDVVLP